MKDKQYTVTWSYDCCVESPEAAARLASAVMLTSGGTGGGALHGGHATFEVECVDGTAVDVDLGALPPEPPELRARIVGIDGEGFWRLANAEERRLFEAGVDSFGRDGYQYQLALLDESDLVGTPEELATWGRCPDRGACHHECKTAPCFRVENCAPLPGVFPGNKWPVRMP